MNVWVLLKKIELKIFKKRNWVLTFFILYLSTLSIFAIVGDRGLWASYRVWTAVKKLERHNDQLSEDVERLRKNIVLFKGSSHTIERYAREELNMHGKNEIQVVFK